ncbi:MAG: OmpA family protein, partial [Acidobacteriota bacterium]
MLFKSFPAENLPRARPHFLALHFFTRRAALRPSLQRPEAPAFGCGGALRFDARESLLFRAAEPEPSKSAPARRFRHAPGPTAPPAPRGGSSRGPPPSHYSPPAPPAPRQTDNAGGFHANVELSGERAVAVVDALTKGHGVDAGQVNPFGVGPAAPEASNATEAGRAKN